MELKSVQSTRQAASSALNHNSADRTADNKSSKLKKSTMAVAETTVLDSDPFFKNQLNLMAGQDRRMKNLFKRV